MTADDPSGSGPRGDREDSQSPGRVEASTSKAAQKQKPVLQRMLDRLFPRSTVARSDQSLDDDIH